MFDFIVPPLQAATPPQLKAAQEFSQGCSEPFALFLIQRVIPLIGNSRNALSVNTTRISSATPHRISLHL